MSFVTWHFYGYGIKVDEIGEIGEISKERLKSLIDLAPIFKEQLQEQLEKMQVTDPGLEDYCDAMQNAELDFGFLGLASILKYVMEEVEGLKFVACDNFDNEHFLIFTPQYPWRMTEREQQVTEESLNDIFTKYVGVLTDKEIDIDYQSVENGG